MARAQGFAGLRGDFSVLNIGRPLKWAGFPTQASAAGHFGRNIPIGIALESLRWSFAQRKRSILEV